MDHEDTKDTKGLHKVVGLLKHPLLHTLRVLGVFVVVLLRRRPSASNCPFGPVDRVAVSAWPAWYHGQRGNTLIVNL